MFPFMAHLLPHSLCAVFLHQSEYSETPAMKIGVMAWMFVAAVVSAVRGFFAPVSVVDVYEKEPEARAIVAELRREQGKRPAQVARDKGAPALPSSLR